MTVASFVVNFSFLQGLAIFLVGYGVYGVGLAIYRIWLSPLSKFPGPKLAALTLWYEFYFDVVKRGKFAWEIRRMHEVYGPIVRINPYELHVSDPNFYDELYTGNSRKRDKFAWSADMFQVPDTMLSTVPHDLHRQRRAPIAPYFSQQAIRRFDPVIRKKLDVLFDRLKEYEKSGEPVCLDDAFTALTTDIITQYAFGISYGWLQAEAFNPSWPLLLKGGSENSLLHKQIPWLTGLMRKIPLEWLMKIKPEMASLVLFQSGLETAIKAVMNGENKQRPGEDFPTIFHDLLASDMASEMTLLRLCSESQTIVAAGTLTAAHYLKTTIYHILANPSILQTLQIELNQAIPNPSVLPPFHDLDRLPYLNAVMNEGFRLSHGIIQRLTRVAPDEDLQFSSYSIPRGTPVGMSSWLLHLNPSLFPSPNTFKPDRWLEPGAEKLQKYLVNFTKGSRICLGKDLARTEIVYTLCRFVRGEGEACGWELWQTGKEDVEIEHDFFNPFPRMESQGVRVIAKSFNGSRKEEGLE
ncbi:putative P450 monooxygenase [Amniculicola lignicola CBS 123094]|uniref:Putative P450 monooxygenase n=1 Tax=Amniculicola lignicola CBS 123094 TaxID=1392246 RepID=A0A6A5WDT9_9PLEO|nr:putative P450 monooxygenase [Amniculicola lignicola CBS 123094]